MHRLFVAARPSAKVRSQLLGLMGGVAGARWQSDDQLHITLRFIGEVDARAADDTMLALSAIRHPPFEIAINDVGTFDRRGAIDTLWAGIAPREAITALHRKMDRAIVGIGLAPEHRAYLPHITLARFGRSGGNCRDFLAANACLTSEPFAIESFGLYVSRSSHDGSAYAELASFSLT